MRLLRILIGVLIGVVALAGGVFVAVLIAVAAAVLLVVSWVRRLRGSGVRRTVPARSSPPGVIDVTATELPSERIER